MRTILQLVIALTLAGCAGRIDRQPDRLAWWECVRSQDAPRGWITACD